MFVKFEGGNLAGDTRIIINKSGLIRLSTGFIKINEDSIRQYAILFYDADRKAIAIKFSSALEKGSLKVTKDKNAGIIAAKSFFTFNQIDLNRYGGKYDWREMTSVETQGRVFLIRLKEHETNF